MFFDLMVALYAYHFAVRWIMGATAKQQDFKQKTCKKYLSISFITLTNEEKDSGGSYKR